MKTALAKVSEDLRSGAGVALSYSVSHIPCLSQALHIHLPFIDYRVSYSADTMENKSVIVPAFLVLM